MFLAGGPTPANVNGTILRVRPAGADVHAGAEDALGRKDRAPLEAFLAGAGAAFSDAAAALG